MGIIKDFVQDVRAISTPYGIPRALVIKEEAFEALSKKYLSKEKDIENGVKKEIIEYLYDNVFDSSHEEEQAYGASCLLNKLEQEVGVNEHSLADEKGGTI